MYARRRPDPRSSSPGSSPGTLVFATILCLSSFLVGCGGGGGSGGGTAAAVGGVQPDFADFVTNLIENETRDDNDPVEINGLIFDHRFEEDEDAFRALLGN